METKVVKPRRSLQQFVAVLVMTIGVAIVWGVLGTWLGSTVESWLRPTDYVWEDIVVTRDGTPAIQTYPSNGRAEPVYRTLDGKPLEINNRDLLSPAYLKQASRPPRFISTPRGWGQTLGLSDGARPPVGWYLYGDDSGTQPGQYLMGFDQLTYLPIGYISRRGFSRGLPAAEDWFQSGEVADYSMGATSPQYLPYNSVPGYTSMLASSNLPLWLLYVIDGGRLQEVNVRERSVREVFSAPELISVGMAAEAAAGDQADADKAPTRVAILTADRIVALDPLSGDKREFKLPEPLNSKSLQAYLLSPEQLLVTWSSHDGRYVEHLLWLSEDGTTVREETVQMSTRNANFSDTTMVVWTAFIAPIPLAWAAMTGLVIPLGMLNDHGAATYGAALAEIFKVATWGVVTVFVLGCLSAWLVARWQRKYFRAHSGAWCAFAFLLGLPAVAAYWLEMRRAKLESCGECQAVAPRDRDTCAACAAPFPAPALVGKEIFA